MTEKRDALAAAAAGRLRVRNFAAAAALLVASTGSSQAAITPSNVDAWQHIMDCAGALLGNPEEHALYCGPGHADAMTFGTNFFSPPPPVVSGPTGSTGSSSCPTGPSGGSPISCDE